MGVIHGEFLPGSGSGVVWAWVILPRLSILQEVRFLVDTGSSRTLLMPRGGARMRVDHARLSRTETVFGIGGIVTHVMEDCTILMKDSSGVMLGFAIQIGAAPPDVEIVELPSLLGRDVLNRMRMVYDPPGLELTLHADSPDFRVSPP